MRLVVTIPAYNEEKTIAKVISDIPRSIKGISSVKVLVVDDGSTDNTVATAKKAGADVVISHSSNKGVGTAFQTGINNALRAGADLIVTADADGQFDPKDIPNLITPILEKKADFVTCSRFLDKNLEPKMPFVKKIGNKMFTMLISMLVDQKFTDTQCGFRAYSRETALRLTVFGSFTYTQEVFLDVATKGLRIVEVPIRVHDRQAGKSKVVTNVFSYTLRALAIILRAIRDYRPLKFFGTLGGGIFSIGLVSSVFLALHWIRTGRTSPYTSLISVSALFFTLGFLVFVIALFADMMDRQRRLSEKILYYCRKESLKEGKDLL